MRTKQVTDKNRMEFLATARLYLFGLPPAQPAPACMRMS